MLSKSNEWKSTVAMMIGGVLDVPPDSIALSEIFGLLVIAGFPKVRYATRVLVGAYPWLLFYSS